MGLVCKTIGQCLSEAAYRYGDGSAFIAAGGTVVYSWEQVERQSDEIAKVLLDLGVGKGSRVGVWSFDTPALALCFYGLVKIGAVAVMLNASHKEAELFHALEYADVELLLIGKGYRDVDYGDVCAPLTAKRTVPGLREVLRIDGRPDHFRSIANLTKYATGITDEELTARKQAVSSEDTAAILFTSGTTSRPKGAMLTHFGMVNNSMALATSLRATSADRFCLAIPLFHCFGLASNLLSCLHSGAALVFLPDRHSDDILTGIQGQRCTLLNAVPTLLLTMIRRPDFSAFDLSSLRAGILGGASVSPDRYLEICRRIPSFRLLSSLGQTEATAGVTITEYDAPATLDAVSVGKFLPHMDGRIISLEDGNTLPVGEAGEVCIRGYNVMKGYCRPDIDGEAVDAEGWLHTGDLGRLDGEGNLYMTGRRKEIIIRGGENISPAELEACIAGDVRVEEVKCIGVPDPHFGEEVCACVLPKAGERMSEESVREWVRDRLAYYKTPKYVLLMDAFERTASGKIAAQKLREYALRELVFRIP